MTVPEPRCERTDLPTSMCAHCRGHDDRPTPAGDASDYGLAFFAQYDGRCADCSGPIDAGDKIAALTDGSGYVCPECLP